MLPPLPCCALSPALLLPGIPPPLHSHPFPPQVEYDNGRVEEFLPGDNLSCDTLRRPDVSAAIAAAMARFHVCMLAGLTAAPAARQGQQQPAAGPAPEAANAQPEQPEQQQQPQLLRPAIFERIRHWHSAAAECGADLQAAGLAALPDEVRCLQHAA